MVRSGSLRVMVRPKSYASLVGRLRSKTLDLNRFPHATVDTDRTLFVEREQM